MSSPNPTQPEEEYGNPELLDKQEEEENHDEGEQFSDEI